MSRDEDLIPRTQLAGLILVFESQSGAAGKQQDPLGLVLVVPEAGRRGLAGRNDALDAHPSLLQQVDHLLILAAGGGVEGRQVVRQEIRGEMVWNQAPGQSQPKTPAVRSP